MPETHFHKPYDRCDHTCPEQLSEAQRLAATREYDMFSTDTARPTAAMAPWAEIDRLRAEVHEQRIGLTDLREQLALKKEYIQLLLEEIANLRNGRP